MLIHTVLRGESLYSIARDYGVNPVQMAAENGFSMEEPLVVGQTVVVQFPKTVHIVREGETLSAVAQLYGVSMITLQRNNRWLEGGSLLRPGQVLVIEYFNEPLGRYSVGGYAYSTIEQGLLRSVLPYLTNVTPFSYGLTEEGSLLELSDAAIRQTAAEYGVGVLLHLSTVTDQVTFSNERSSSVLGDAALQRRLAEEVLRTIQVKGYAGVDVDFEYLPAQEGEAYAAFVALLRSTLQPYGYTVTVALSPKTYADQPGLLYEGHNYALLGAAADFVFLMTYEWGYTYGPPMAVAPLPNVQTVVEYALSEIPAEKCILGVPNYGYNWTLPYLQGASRAQSLSNEAAVMLARRYGAEIFFDETARAPWFRYWDEEGREHVVWFEDARSIQDKLLLAARYGMAGVGYWNLDRPFAQNWLVVNALYDVL